MIMETVVIDLTFGSPMADHYAIRHKPSGQYVSWDNTLTPNVGEAVRYGMRAKADLHRGGIDPATRDEYETVGLRYQPAAG